MNIEQDAVPADDEDTSPSKSARKREVEALQALGTRLTGLSPGALSRIPMPEELAQAVVTARNLRQREARRRQLQYIGKLMRRIDPVPIEAALQALEQGQREDAKAFQQLESLRDQIVSGDESGIDVVIGQYANADRQHLRQLQRQARKELEAQRPPAAARKLFRYLRELAEGAKP